MDRRRWTDAAARAEPLAEAGQKVMADSECKPLRLVVGASKRSWAAQLYASGRSKWVTLGDASLLSVKDARRRAAQLALDFAATGAAAPKPKTMDLEAAWSATVEEAKRRGRSERTVNWYAEMRRNHLKPFERRPLDSITRREVREWHAKVGRNKGPAAADGALRTLSAIYGVAFRIDDGLPANPCAAVTAFGSAKREVDVEPADFARVADSINTLNNVTSRAFLRIAMLTGLRPGIEIRTLTWADVDLDAMVLRLRAPKGGAERAQALPMTTQAARELAELPRIAGSRWVFASSRVDGPIVVPRLPLAGAQTYDLRRMFRSAAFDAGVAEDRVKVLLNHKLSGSGNVTDRYLTVRAESVRGDAQKVADHIDGLVAEGRLTQRVSAEKM